MISREFMTSFGREDPIRVAILDDEPAYLKAVKDEIERLAPGMIELVGEAATEEQMYEVVRREHPELAIIDLRLNREDDAGLRVLDALKVEHPGLKCLIYTIHYERVDYFVRALWAGADGYALKTPTKPQYPLPTLIVMVARSNGYYEPEFVRLMAELLEETNLPPRDIRGFRVEQALTARERDVLRELAQGIGNREISERLGITVRTVKFYVTQILGKLQVPDRYAAAKVAKTRPNLLDPDGWKPRN